ncbi:MAG TPA: hypothetical protein EYP85_07700 [Armatimonadetes bacterium]|nr:hypothetical protein [Armatimonadota bacterium]
MRRYRWLGLIVGGLVVWGLWSSRTPNAPRPQQRELLLDRLWIERLPRSERDKFHLFVALFQNQVGMFLYQSLWEGEWTGFQWHFRQGDERLHLRFPQTGQTAAIEWKITRSDRPGFDYCLTMKGNPRGPHRWYSKRGWEIRSLGEVRGQLPPFLSGL